MPIEWVAVLFCAGMLLSAYGGKAFVKASSEAAGALGLPKFLVGATVVSVATSLPELCISVFSALHHSPEIAVGNAVGSVTVNLGLILGLSMICMPARIERKHYLFKAVLLTAAAVLTLLFASKEKLGVLPAVLLTGLFVLFCLDNAKITAEAPRANGLRTKAGTIPGGKKGRLRLLAGFAGGAAAIAAGAELLVVGGSGFALFLGVPQRVVATVAVALGSSLPELITTFTAIAKRQHTLSFGNLLGASVIDLTLVLPTAVFCSGGTLPVSRPAFTMDLPVCLALCLVATLPVLFRKKSSPLQGAVLLCGYLISVLFVCGLITP